MTTPVSSTQTRSHALAGSAPDPMANAAAAS